MAIDNQNNEVTGSMSPQPQYPFSSPFGSLGKRIANLAMKHEQLKMQRRCQMTKPNSQSLLEDGQSKGTRQRNTVKRKHMYPMF